MRRFFALLTPFLISLTGLLEIDQVKEIIEKPYPSAKPIIIVVCCVSSLLSFVFAAYLPQVRYEILAGKRWTLLSETVEAILLDYSAYELNANIMITKRKFIHNFYPKNEDRTKKKITLLERFLELYGSIKKLMRPLK